jgi:RimJ/RimL family protein N-acetyltransferase
MPEDLVTQYGILKPLFRDDISFLRRDIDDFEDHSGLALAPYILDDEFLRVLGSKTESDVPEDDSGDWAVLWAIVHDGSTVVGCLDFSEPPRESGSVTLRWTINPEWIASPLAAEAVRAMVEWAFDRDDCRTVVISGDDRPFGEMAGVFRRLGFRPGEKTDGKHEPRTFRLTKAVEGKLL